MNKKKLLEYLKLSLEKASELKSQDDAVEWANTVLPLLKSFPTCYANFYNQIAKFHLPLSSYSLGPAFSVMTGQLQQAISELELEFDIENPSDKPPEEIYVSDERIRSISSITSSEFNYKKLEQLLIELNQAYNSKAYYSIAALVRIIIDHVPPIFGCSSFAEVSNNYQGGTKSFKDQMQRLEQSARKIGDQHIHTQIRKKEALPTFTQVNFRNEIDTLLMEIVRLSK